MFSINKSESNIAMRSNCIFDNRYESIPFLTIIIPTYRRTELLAQTLNSLVAQSNKNFEVIVVDNDYENTCGLDQLVISEGLNLPLALYRNSFNLGMFGNWDRGIALSRTRWISILHDDDLLESTFVSDIIRAQRHVPNFELLFFRVKTFFGSNNPTVSDSSNGAANKCSAPIKFLLKNTIYKLSLLDYFLKNEHVGTLSAVFLRENAISLKGFSPFVEKYGYVSDYAFFIEYCRQFDSTYLYNRSAAYYRFHVNESLNYQVVLNFIDGCSILRNEILLNYGIRGNLKKIVNSIFTALQIKASAGLNCPEYAENLKSNVIQRYGFSLQTYNISQLIARLSYKIYQLRYAFSRRI